MDAIDKKRLRQDRKNMLRRQYRQEARQALFIKEYISERYSEAYKEAAGFYNYVNSLHPQKKDLRRTEEFKAIKMGFAYNPSNTTTETETQQTASPTETQQTVSPTETQQTANPTEIRQTTTNQKTMELRIPLMSTDLFTKKVTQENVITTAYTETLADDTDLFLNQEIPDDVYQALLTELQKDPDLSKIMDDMELSPIMDMDIDLPVEDDRLERELCELW